MLGIKALRDANEKDLIGIKSELSSEDYQKVLYVIQENERALRASEALKNNDLKTLGDLLFETHNGLKNQYRVSCEELDFLVDKAKENPGVIGARIRITSYNVCYTKLLRILLQKKMLVSSVVPID